MAKSTRQGGAHASDAESDDSEVTTVFTAQDIIDGVGEMLERKALLGGRPTRPIKEYRKVGVPLAPPTYVAPDYLRGSIPTPPEHSDETYFKCYAVMENVYFSSELRAWEAFLRRKHRRWQRRNDAAGGTVPPPPPVLDTDPLELHSQYLE